MSIDHILRSHTIDKMDKNNTQVIIEHEQQQIDGEATLKVVTHEVQTHNALM